MNTTATQPLTTFELLTETQASTNIYLFSNLDPLDTSTVPTFTQLLAEYKASIDKPQIAWDPLGSNERADPFAIYQKNLAHATPQPVRWLWQKRLPLSGFTLLDGDHDCGKSLLALKIAACVSSGAPLPDGSPTIQGGVVVVTPNVDATTTQLQLLTALGANLDRVEILSFIQEPAPSSHISNHHPFSLPEDLLPLLQAIDRVDARLVIFDPFISLISQKHRCTDQRLCHLLTELNQHLIQRNVACLLIRHCHAKGGHARPSRLERSDHFATIAVSRLLLAPDPIQPDRLLLSHVTNRHAALTPTLTLQIQSQPANPEIPHITILGTHSLKAKDLLNSRPDTLHRQLLTHHLLQLITAATDPIPVANLYSLSPHSSAFQIQRSLADLLRMGQIHRPARGIYTLPPATPVSQLNSFATTTPNPEPAVPLNSFATTTPNSESVTSLNPFATTTPNLEPATSLDSCAAITPNSESVTSLNSFATITPNSEPATSLDSCAAITPPISESVTSLDSTPAITPNPEPVTSLNPTPAITLKPKTTKRPHKGRSKHWNTKKRR